MTAASSVPIVPPSPAWGLRPATASRGSAMPKRVRRSCARMRAVSVISAVVISAGHGAQAAHGWSPARREDRRAPASSPAAAACRRRRRALRETRCGRDRRSRRRRGTPSGSGPVTRPRQAPWSTASTARSMERDHRGGRERARRARMVGDIAGERRRRAGRMQTQLPPRPARPRSISIARPEALGARAKEIRGAVDHEWRQPERLALGVELKDQVRPDAGRLAHGHRQRRQLGSAHMRLAQASSRLRRG